MSTLEFIAACLDALAWPAVALAALIVFRKPLAELLLSVTNLRVGRLDVAFRDELRSAEAAAHDIPPAATRSRPARFEQARRQATEDPARAVLSAWRELETIINNHADRAHIKAAPGARVMPLVLSALLQAEGALTEPQLDLIMRLKQLRDRVVHDTTTRIAAADAIEYVTLAEQLGSTLESTTPA
jgi:hypothetical protein